MGFDEQAAEPAANSVTPARVSSDGAAKTRTPLTLDHIVTTAIDLIEAEGPDALSMRRLATRLGSSPMATYHHVADRQALMEAVSYTHLDVYKRQHRLPGRHQALCR